MFVHIQLGIQNKCHAKNEQAYKCYMIDSFNDTTIYDISILEKLCDSSLKLKRRGPLLASYRGARRSLYPLIFHPKIF